MQLRYLMDFYRDKKKSWGVEDIFGETYYIWQILFLDLSEVFPYCTLPLQSLISCMWQTWRLNKVHVH